MLGIGAAGAERAYEAAVAAPPTCLWASMRVGERGTTDTRVRGHLTVYTQLTDSVRVSVWEGCSG